MAENRGQAEGGLGKARESCSHARQVVDGQVPGVQAQRMRREGRQGLVHAGTMGDREWGRGGKDRKQGARCRGQAT